MAINLDNITIDRIGWKDDPDTSTPLDSGNLKEMENNSEAGINTLKSNVQIALTELESKTNELNTEIDNLKNYSTEEVKTGEYWIDGKPIYRKVFNLTVSDTNEKLIPHNIENVSNIWLGNKSYILSGINYIPVNHYRDSGIFVWTLVNDTNIRIKIGATAWINKPTYITLEYTKTTD